MGGVCRVQFFPQVCEVGGLRRRPSQPFAGVDNIQPLLEAKENLGLPCGKTLKSVEDGSEGELENLTWKILNIFSNYNNWKSKI